MGVRTLDFAVSLDIYGAKHRYKGKKKILIKKGIIFWIRLGIQPSLIKKNSFIK